jgi:hypothetical protein
MDIVECHSEFAYAERPVALTWEGQRLEIGEILAAWRVPEGRRFRVRTRSLRLFELTYREADDAWQIQPLTGG